MLSPARPDTGEFSSIRCRLHLFAERFLTDLRGTEHEIELPVLSMRMDYGGTELRVADRSRRFFVATDLGMHEVERDLAQERRLQCLVESFGAVEVEQAEDLIPPMDSQADYIVQPCGDIHSWCSFAVYAVAQLRAAGINVTVAEDYPYQVVDDDPPCATERGNRSRPHARNRSWNAFALSGSTGRGFPTLGALEFLERG